MANDADHLISSGVQVYYAPILHYFSWQNWGIMWED